MFELYKKKLGYGEQKSYDYGKMLRSHNNEISNQSFEYDAAYIKCLINGETVDAKYFYGSAGDVNKDEPRYNLQFRSGVHYPIGSIVSIEEEEYDESEYAYWKREDIEDRPCYIMNGIHYRRWIIVNKTKELQFRKYYILPCDWCLKWICEDPDGVRRLHKQVCIMRIRSSYSSGIYQQYQLTTMEAQDGVWLPMNEKTATIALDQRVMVSDYRSLNPQSYKVSDYYSNHPIGVLKVTLYRDTVISSDDKENLIADGIGFEDPKEPIVPSETKLILSFNVTPTGGRTTTFTPHYYVDGEEIDITTLGFPIQWYVNAAESKYHDLIGNNVEVVGEDTEETFKIKLSKNPNILAKGIIVTLWIDDGASGIRVDETYEIE